MKVKGILLTLAMLTACGPRRIHAPETTDTTDQDKLKAQVLALQDQINSVITSDFATCSSAGIETADLLIRNICKIAQASTIEGQTTLKGQLEVLHENLQAEIDSDRIDILGYQSTIANMNSLLAQLQIQITTNLSSYDIGSDTTLAGYGPFFDTVLRDNGRSKINAYSESFSNIVLNNNPLQRHGSSTISVTIATDLINITGHGLANGAVVKFSTTNTLPAPLSSATTYYVITSTTNSFQVSLTPGGSAVDITSNGSGTQSIASTQLLITTASAHGLSVGNTVNLAGLSAGGGLVSGNITGDWLVAAVPSTTTLTITLGVFPNSSSSGFGGSAGILKKVLGRGMSTAWVTANGEQLKVSMGTLSYNFLITGASTVFALNPAVPPVGWGTPAAPGSGFLCWKIDNASATATQIKAGGASVTCQ